jgi:nucleotide-binding universal stress UspA family protein
VWNGEESAMPEVNAYNTIPEKILVPIDFSSSSHEALEQATALAEHFHARLHLVNVIPEDGNPENAKKESEKRFAVSLDGLAAKGIKASSSIEVDNDVASRILDVIDREEIDRVVVSTHGVTGWHPMVFGSIAEKLVRLVHIPLLLIHTEKPESTTRVTNGRLMEWW